MLGVKTLGISEFEAITFFSRVKEFLNHFVKLHSTHEVATKAVG